MQKDVFDHNFRTKALGMMILASRYMFLRSRNPMVPFVLTYDLTFQGYDLCEITFWVISQLLMCKMFLTFNTK